MQKADISSLRLTRLLMGKSQYEVSRATGISQTEVSLFERGFRIPSPEQVKRLAHALRKSVEELFPFESEARDD